MRGATKMVNFRKLLAFTLIGVSTFGPIETHGRRDGSAANCNISLDLTGVGLNHLPNGFVRNGFITNLTLDGNGISSVSPGAFRFVPNLYYLSLAKNKFSVLNLGQFAQLENLETLNLSENCKLRTVVRQRSPGSAYRRYDFYDHEYTTTPPPEKIFCNFTFDVSMPNLTHLVIERNDIKDLAFGIYSLPKLSHLYLSHNPLDLNFETILRLNRVAPNLRHLYLRGCGIRDLKMYKMPTLTSLHVDDNEIEVIFYGEIHTNSALNLRGVEQLKELSVSRNRISLINSNSFYYTTNLVTLDLSYNKLQDIEAGTFDYLLELRSLSLAHNELFLQSGDDIFANTINLEILDLSGNTNMSHINPQLLQNLTSLKQLRLNNTGISDIDCALFYETTSLEVLDLAGNQLSTIPEGSLPISDSLISLNLDDNKFTTTDDIFIKDKPNMLSLSLKGNPLKTIGAPWILDIGSPNLTITIG